VPTVATKNPVSNLAKWSSELLAGSAVLFGLVVVALFGLTNLRGRVLGNPKAAAIVVLMLACYVVCFVCLRQARLRSGEPRLLHWVVSLVAACVPLVVLGLAMKLGLAVLGVGVLEAVAILLHLVAIVVIYVRRRIA
jgi:hypothetical protein